MGRGLRNVRYMREHGCVELEGETDRYQLSVPHSGGSAKPQRHEDRSQCCGALSTEVSSDYRLYYYHKVVHLSPKMRAGTLGRRL